MAVLTENTYKPLTVESAINLAINLQLFTNKENLVCKEIGDGNLNLVFHIVDNEKQKGIIIKQALPYAKVVGESWPLTIHRSEIEANALKTHGEFVSHLVPKVYHTDKTLAITVMEDLSHLTIARTGLIDGQNYPLLSSHVGEYLAKTLFYTSDYALHPFKKKDLVKQFSNPELCKITEDLVFTDPFFDVDTNDFEEELKDTVREIWKDASLKFEVAKLKKQFLTETEALLHGDLHTGSIFASITETKVIDPEFAFYGPFGFDVGQFFANLIFQVIVRTGEQRQVILNHLEKTWDIFQTIFTDSWQKDCLEPFAEIESYLPYILGKIFTDSIGFAGCELIRRTIGLSHVKDLDGITDIKVRIAAKKTALKLGRACILYRHKINGMEDYISFIKQNINE
ncbi:methylthioribose kinase [Heyndrickxia shackletonii]|uniref:Methylthioribose kinase n=1 Tax=Heyndrickxia shackletonii TaxID=157838 RepID=A0A0Q3WZG8_9BACI|nr:S-methyl-5-thioribose kinase [Heyndrickxia shackletonii]KQL54845.1 methylthioribose kinase [Heyndrickxia shackletonii]NEY99505.1 S-methyl-5-thioribose kinase [Heyndrickxia shackletonii]